MSPTVFGYVVLFTLLLAGAAAAMEWGARGRIAARHFWTAAIVLAVLAPAAALTWHAVAERNGSARAGVAPGPDRLATIIVTSGRAAVRGGGRFIGRDALIRLLAPSRRAVHAALTRVDRDFPVVAIVGWIVLSLALTAWLVVGVFYWRRARRAWRRTTLDGVSIDVSTGTGPAVVGLMSHRRIVLPSWATVMQPEYRRLVLAHECEHISARDPERLALAIVALVLMPWNIGLWWCAARLRRAIELDCDTRVLRRFPSAKEYGHVLLEVAARGRHTGPLAIPMVALLRLPSELELRLRVMTAARRVGVRSVVIGGVVALVAVAAAFTTPVPTIVSRVAAPLPGTTVWPLRPDTGSKRRIDSLAVLRRQNDSLRVHESELVAQMRALTRAKDSLASTESTLKARRERMTTSLRELLAAEAKPGGTENKISGEQMSPDSVATALRTLDAFRDRVATQQRGLRAAELRPSGPANKYTTYFSFQVDKPAKMLATTVTPVYPDSLRRAGIGGEVDAEFTVDTTGRVDQAAGIKITNATDPLFEQAVRTALPKMTFAPAEIRGMHIKQLVQQPFTFAITKDPE